MFEIVILILFIFTAYVVVLTRNLYLIWRDRRQERALRAISVETLGQPSEVLVRRLGGPYEIERGTTGRELYVWKFPPSTTLPRGDGLLTVIATIDGGAVANFHWKRKV